MRPELTNSTHTSVVNFHQDQAVSTHSNGTMTLSTMALSITTFSIFGKTINEM